MIEETDIPDTVLPDAPEIEQDDSESPEITAPVETVEPEASPAPQVARSAEKPERATISAEDSMAAALDRVMQENNRRAREQENAMREREMLANMSDSERAVYELKKEREAFAREAQLQRIASADMIDQVKYQTRAESNELYKKYNDKVEAKIREERAKGSTVDRETVLKYLIGESMLSAQKSGSVSKQRKTGAENVARATTKPISAQTSQPKLVKTNDAKAAREARLSNVRI